jgi:hypothetical protein
MGVPKRPEGVREKVGRGRSGWTMRMFSRAAEMTVKGFPAAVPFSLSFGITMSTKSGTLEKYFGIRRARRGRIAGRQAQMMPVLTSIAERVACGGFWKDKSVVVDMLAMV